MMFTVDVLLFRELRTWVTNGRMDKDKKLNVCPLIVEKDGTGGGNTCHGPDNPDYATEYKKINLNFDDLGGRTHSEGLLSLV